MLIGFRSFIKKTFQLVLLVLLLLLVHSNLQVIDIGFCTSDCKHVSSIVPLLDHIIFGKTIYK